MKIKIVLLVVVALMIQSCEIQHTPENYFDRAVLNANLIVNFGSEDLNELVSGKENKSLMGSVDGNFVVQDNAELYITSWKIVDIENKIKSIEELKPENDANEMIKRSLTLFNFVLERYKAEYLDIAKLLDSGASKAEIDTAISNVDTKYVEKFDELYNSLMEVGIPYAKANGINVTY